jgi:hypothetical protein
MARIIPASRIRDEPSINPVPIAKADVKSPTNKQQSVDSTPHLSSTKDGDRGDILACGFYRPNLDTVFDVRIVDLDQKSYATKSATSTLTLHEKDKRNKYLKACQEQRRSFAPIVISSDGILAYEAKNLVRHLAKKLAKKWSQPYSQVMGFLSTQISIATIRANHTCLRGPRNPFTKTSFRVEWDLNVGNGLGLVETIES